MITLCSYLQKKSSIWNSKNSITVYHAAMVSIYVHVYQQIQCKCARYGEKVKHVLPMYLTLI